MSASGRATKAPFPVGARGLELVRQLAERDGGGCAWCSREQPLDLCSPDHLVPRARGGCAHIDNYVHSCIDCNSRRGTLPWRRYAAERAAGGGAVRLERLESAARRGWESKAASVARLAVVEFCYAERICSPAQFARKAPRYAWHLTKLQPEDVAERYLAVHCSAQERHAALRAAYEQELGARTGGIGPLLEFIRPLHRGERNAAKALWAGKGSLAEEIILSHELKRCFTNAAMKAVEQRGDLLWGI